MDNAHEISRELFPFESKWCDVDGVPIHYIDEGTGPPLLLVHGNFMWSFSYRRLIKSLSTDYRCVSIDLAGMGLSGKPHRLGKPEFGYTYEEQSRVIEKAIEKLSLQDITFLSFDHGGPIGLGAVARQPDRLRGIVIANSWAWSCHSYRSTRIWSKLAPLSTRLLRRIMLNKKR